MSGAYPVQDFSDGRAFVIFAGDSRNPLVCADDHLGVQQAADGPTFVVVGRAVTDQRMTANMPAIIKRVREMRKDKAQRIADTAPKGMREAIRQEARELAGQ